MGRQARESRAYLMVDRGRGAEREAVEGRAAAAAAAEGGRRQRRRGCWCGSWWVAESESARAAESARSRVRRAAQARASGARASPREGRAAGLRLAPSPPAASGRARAPRFSAVGRPGRLLSPLPTCLPSPGAAGRRADRHAHARSVAAFVSTKGVRSSRRVRARLGPGLQVFSPFPYPGPGLVSCRGQGLAIKGWHLPPRAPIPGLRLPRHRALLGASPAPPPPHSPTPESPEIVPSLAAFL